jgi:hypothetical protein
MENEKDQGEQINSSPGQQADAIIAEKENKESMEVHHHPDLHHKRKRFKEYILEFIMIFLAVTLGFLAESLRESISEHHRERMYIEGFIKNLQDDTAQMRQVIAYNDVEVKGLDTIISISKANYLQVPVQDSIFWYSFKYLFDIHTFHNNDITITQLRNAGGYSLIRKPNVADSIALYEANNSDLKDQEKFFGDAFKDMWEEFQHTFDQTLINNMAHVYKKDHKMPFNVNVLISNNKEKMDLLYNHYYNMDLVLRGYLNMLRVHQVYLVHLIKFLQSRYDE